MGKTDDIADFLGGLDYDDEDDDKPDTSNVTKKVEESKKVEVYGDEMDAIKSSGSSMGSWG